MKKVQQYFKDYPTSKQCFETSDGFLFHHEGDARLHATGLKNKTVTSYDAGAVGDTEKKATKETEQPTTPVVETGDTGTGGEEKKTPAAKETDKKPAAAKGAAKKTTGK
jgi:hypothetical protein